MEEWLAFERIYGLPDIFFMTSQISTVLQACLTNKKKIYPGDFVPYFQDDHSGQTPAEMLANLRASVKTRES